MKKKANQMAAEVIQEEEIQVIEEESTAKRILNTVINVILVLSIALAAVCTYVSYVSTSGSGVPSLLGIQVFSIQTESMYPTLLPGDLIFDTSVRDTSELRKGDVITYWTIINGERVLNTHRIHEIYDGGGYLIFATKGDNNSAADALTVHESEVVGKYKAKIGGLGKVFDYLQTSTGFLIVVVIPVFIFFLYHVVQFFRVLFEYQNVKNRIKYEQERGRTEDLIAAQQQQQAQAKELERAAIEAELREKLKAELLASMGQSAPTAEPEEKPAPKKSAAKKKAAVKKVVEKKPEPKPEPEPVEEQPEEIEEIVPAEPVKEEPVAQEITPEETEEELIQEAEAEEEASEAAEDAEDVEDTEESDESDESGEEEAEEDEEAEEEDSDIDLDDLDDEDLDEEFDDEELYAGGSLDDLLFGGDDQETEEE